MMKSRMWMGATMLVTALYAISPAWVVAEEDPVHENLLTLANPAAESYAAAWDEPLMPAFETAAKVYAVPAELLLTLGQMGSAFENRAGAPTIERGYGVMALRENALGGDSLAQAATLTGASVDQLKLDPVANIRGAAAVLDDYARQAAIDRAGGLESWVPAILRYAGLDDESNQYFAMQVYQRLEAGFRLTNSRGETFALSGRALGIEPESLAPPGAASQSPDYPPAVWDPAPSCNYTAGTYSKDVIIIHTIEGSAAGARSWIKNCSSNVSAHYVVSEAGGVWQMVREDDKAWHVGCYNSRSIGIEHEGYAGSPSHPQSLYDASADLCRDICNDWGIPKARTPGGGPGIMGHVDANNCCCHGDHWDPGPGWDWNYFIGRVNGGGGGNGNVGDFVSETIPAAMRKGFSYNCSVTMKNSGSQIWACWPSGTMLTVGQFTGPAVCKLIPYPFYEIYTNPCVIEVAQECTFPFALDIPSDAPLGNYEISWQMKDNSEWFNSTGHNAVFRKTVYVHDNFSEMVSNNIPSAMSPGQSYNCSITMKNSGSQTWAAWPSGTMLTVGQFNGPQVCKLIPYPFYEIYVNPPAIEPAQECTFPFTINVPADTPAGTYELKWEMKDNGCWFGQIFTKSITVGSGFLNNKASHISNTIPATMNPGQSYNCTIAMKNTGVGLWAAWPIGTMLTVGQFNGPVANKLIPYPYHEIYIPQNGGSLPEEYITRPNATCSFPFSISVPADTSPGTYEIRWQMKDNSEWFNSDTHTAVFTKNVTVAAPAVPPTVTAAASRKSHTGVGAFDINVAAVGAVECRQGGPTQVLVTFNKAIQGVGGLNNADVSLSSGSVNTVSIAGSQLTIDLSGATNGMPLTVGFPGIADAANTAAVTTGTVCFGVLAGDTTADRSVNIFDLIGIRNNLNQPVDGTRFRSDVNTDGSINIFDLIATRNSLNTSIVVCP